MSTPVWAVHAAKQRFSSGPTMGEDGQKWCRAAKRWLGEFLAKYNATGFDFHNNHYEWSAFAKIGDQWWYFSSGDVRFKIMKSLLVRTASGPRDYTGGHNQFVSYESEDFESALARILRV